MLVSLGIAFAVTLAAPAMKNDEVSTISEVELPWNLIAGLDAGALYQIPQQEKVLLSSSPVRELFKTLCDMLAYTDLLSDADNTSDLLRILEENVLSACLWFKNIDSEPSNATVANHNDSYLPQNSSDIEAPDNSTCLPEDMDYFRLACAKTQVTLVLVSARLTAVSFCDAFNNCSDENDNCVWVEEVFPEEEELVERILNATIGC